MNRPLLPSLLLGFSMAAAALANNSVTLTNFLENRSFRIRPRAEGSDLVTKIQVIPQGMEHRVDEVPVYNFEDLYRVKDTILEGERMVQFVVVSAKEGREGRAYFEITEILNAEDIRKKRQPAEGLLLLNWKYPRREELKTLPLPSRTVSAATAGIESKVHALEPELVRPTSPSLSAGPVASGPRADLLAGLPAETLVEVDAAPTALSTAPTETGVVLAKQDVPAPVGAWAVVDGVDAAPIRIEPRPTIMDRVDPLRKRTSEGIDPDSFDSMCRLSGEWQFQPRGADYQFVRENTVNLQLVTTNLPCGIAIPCPCSDANCIVM